MPTETPDFFMARHSRSMSQGRQYVELRGAVMVTYCSPVIPKKGPRSVVNPATLVVDVNSFSDKG